MAYFRDIAPNYLSNHHSNSALLTCRAYIQFLQILFLGNQTYVGAMSETTKEMFVKGL
jgi:hypothetical protein